MALSKNRYCELIVKNIPRIIGQLNRNPASKTYGCFHRDFWHYKVLDMPSARLQEASLTLALIYSHKYPGSNYHRSKKILEYAKQSMLFWVRIQNSDGSFNEWYPGERSFVCTAFSTYAVSEAYLLLEKEFEPSEKKQVMDALKKAAKFLTKRDKCNVSNQKSGAIAALSNIYSLTSEKHYLKSAKGMVSDLLGCQNSEGWFPEYNGADIGYSSVLVDYFGKYYKKTGDDEILPHIERLCDFLSYFIHPDGTTGGEYCSRNTQYLVPHGFEVFSKEINSARFLANAAENMMTGYDFLDDRYLLQYSYTFLQAFDDYCSDKISENTGYDTKKIFDNCGIAVVDNDPFQSYIGLKKGGVIKVFDKKTKRQLIDDCGILVFDKKNVAYSSQWLRDGIEYEFGKDSVSVKGNLYKVDDLTMNTALFFIQRPVQIVSGLSYDGASLLKGVLRKRLITDAKKSSFRYERSIVFGDNQVKITDVISKDASATEVSKILVGGKYSLNYISSSRFFHPKESDSIPYNAEKDEVDALNRKRTLKIEQVFHKTCRRSQVEKK